MNNLPITYVLLWQGSYGVIDYGLWIIDYGERRFCNVEVAKIKKKARGRKNMRVVLARMKEK